MRSVWDSAESQQFSFCLLFFQFDHLKSIYFTLFNTLHLQCFFYEKKRLGLAKVRNKIILHKNELCTTYALSSVVSNKTAGSKISGLAQLLFFLSLLCTFRI